LDPERLYACAGGLAACDDQLTDTLLDQTPRNLRQSIFDC
jgi:hypothetical protein